MNQKQMLITGKWVIMGILGAFNFLSYLLNGALYSLVLAIVVFIYSIYEFFHILSGRKLHLGIKLYLFTFYLLAVISLILGLRSFVTGNVNSLMLSLLFITGDTGLILYTIHKLGTMTK